MGLPSARQDCPGRLSPSARVGLDRQPGGGLGHGAAGGWRRAPRPGPGQERAPSLCWCSQQRGQRSEPGVVRQLHHPRQK